MKLLSGHIEEVAIALLLREGPLSTRELLEKIYKKHPCTKQGVYRVLRKLRVEEKIVLYKSIVSINNFWREQLQLLITTNGTNLSVVGDLRGLKKGDRISIKIKGLSAADQVWSHLFVGVENELPNHHPLFLYNPHNWTSLLREDTDRVHAERLERKHRPIYLTIGSVTELDKAVTRAMEFKHFEYNFNLKLRAPDYIAVVGDYVFQLRLLGSGNDHINSIFSSEDDPLQARKLLEKLDAKIACRIIIEKNPIKALQWKKRLGRDFYIPKKYRDF